MGFSCSGGPPAWLKDVSLVAKFIRQAKLDLVYMREADLLGVGLLRHIVDRVYIKLDDIGIVRYGNFCDICQIFHP